MKRKWMVLAALGVLLAAGIVWGQLKAVRDDAGDTAYQSIAGEGQLIEGTMDAYGRLWVNVGADSTQTAPAAGAITGVSVGATTTQVLAAGAARKRVLLVNDSDEAVYVAIGTAAVMNRGIRLSPLGGSVELDVVAGCTLVINAICTSGTKTLTVQSLSSS